MFKSIAKTVAVAALTYVAFQVGRNWDDISNIDVAMDDCKTDEAVAEVVTETIEVVGE